MTVHYHGLPLTPEVMLLDLGGRNMCVSFATSRPGQLAIALDQAQQLMFDNGAYTIKQQGGVLDQNAFYAWLEPLLGHPHWAVVPDVIDGTVEQQRNLLATWPYPRELGAPVFHIALSDDYLLELTDQWPRVCLGSSGDFWNIRSVAWRRRMDAIQELLACKRRCAPNLHGLRMMDQIGKGWSLLASADSVNVARNFKDYRLMPGAVANRIDRVNGSTVFLPARSQVEQAR